MLHKIKLILEKGEGNDIWGRVLDTSYGGLHTVSDSVQGVKDNVIMLLEDHLEHDGERALPWKKILQEGYEFEISWYEENDSI